MRVFDLAIKDLRQILRERQSAFFLLIMPVVFTLLFGVAFGGFGGGEGDSDPRLPVSFINQDEGMVSQQLVTLLTSSELLRLVTSDDDWQAAGQMVSDGDMAAALMVPADFSEQMQAGLVVPLQLLVDPTSTTGFTIESEIEAAVSRLLSALDTAQISTETAVAQGLLSDQEARERYLAESLDRAVAAWRTPPVQVEPRNSAVVEAEGEETAVYSDNAFAHTSPGMMAQFVMAGLITAAQVLVLERKSGALRRLLTTNMSPASILVGHYLAMFVMIVVQLLILILFGQWLLKLPYFRAPAATLLLVIASALFAASMGLLIGALAKNEEQVIIFSLVPMFILAGLGGAWMPIEFTPPTVQRIAYLTPIAWMVDGLKDIIVRGLGLVSVLPAIAVLLAYAILFWILAAWRFRFE